MIALFQAHSGVRFLVLLAGVVALAYFAFGLATRRPVGRAVRVFGSVFVGLLDLQILLGAALLISRSWYPALIGHLVMMVLAAIAAHVLLAINRRRARPGFALPLIGVGIALVLILGGIYAIRPNPFTVTRVR